MASPELRLATLGRESPTWRLADLAEELEGRVGDVAVRVDLSGADGPAALLCGQPREVIGQILRELVNNAAEACRGREGSEGVKVVMGLDGETVDVLVEDDGVGLDPEAVDAAFDPFFSTREEGQGMGLGLYLARAHLRQLGGAIELTSTLGVGSRVRVRFPLGAPVDRSQASIV